MIKPFGPAFNFRRSTFQTGKETDRGKGTIERGQKSQHRNPEQNPPFFLLLPAEFLLAFPADDVKFILGIHVSPVRRMDERLRVFGGRSPAKDIGVALWAENRFDNSVSSCIRKPDFWFKPGFPVMDNIAEDRFGVYPGSNRIDKGVTCFIVDFEDSGDLFI